MHKLNLIHMLASRLGSDDDCNPCKNHWLLSKVVCHFQNPERYQWLHLKEMPVARTQGRNSDTQASSTAAADLIPSHCENPYSKTT